MEINTSNAFKLSTLSLATIVVIAFVVIFSISFIRQSRQGNEKAYISVNQKDKIVIREINITQGKIIRKLEIPTSGEPRFSYFTKFIDHPDDIFLVESEFEVNKIDYPKSYFFVIDKKNFSVQHKIPFDFSVQEVRDVPTKNQILVSGFNFAENIAKGASKFVSRTLFSFRGVDLEKSTSSVDQSSVSSEYHVYYNARLINVESPYLGVVKTLILPNSIDLQYDFNRYIQPIVFNEEKEAILLAYKKDGGRNLVLIDLGKRGIVQEETLSSQSDMSVYRIILSLSPDQQKLYVFEDNDNRDDRILVYQANTLKLLKEIKIPNLMFGDAILNAALQPQVTITSDKKYLLAIFRGYSANTTRQIPKDSGYILILNLETNHVDTLKISDGVLSSITD